MRINRIGLNQRAVVILGAGATRGASFVDKLTGSLPPLDSDFFTQAQRLSSAKPSSLIEDLIENVVGTFGNNFALTMEGYLTRLEQLANVFDDYRFQGRPTMNRYRTMRDQFLQVLAAVLDEAVGRDPKCEYHERLVRALTPKDTIISYNYDWLIDHTLKTQGAGKWNPRSGYSVNVYTQGKRGAGGRYWACTGANGHPILTGSSVQLLKLHGSMNWFPVATDVDPPRLALRTRWWHQRGDLKFEIAPPEWNKPIRYGIYRPLWRQARRALRSAKALAFIGYSLPATDLPAQALFMVDSNAPKLEFLVTVSPDGEARRRIRQTLARRIDDKTRVLSFDRFKDFAAFVGDS